MIYFLECETTVKIGWTNQGTLESVKRRVRSFEVGNPFPIRILAVMPGCASVEFKLHRQFAGARIHGEWFKRTRKCLISLQLMGFLKLILISIACRAPPVCCDFYLIRARFFVQTTVRIDGIV